MKVLLSKEDIELYNLTDEGKAYLEYNDKVGGEPLGYTTGMPNIDIIETYKICIKKGITWQELLVEPKWDEIK